MPIDNPSVKAVTDRISWEAQYVRDVLFLSGETGVCHVSAASMQRLYDGLVWCLTTLRPMIPSTPGVVPPPPTNTPI